MSVYANIDYYGVVDSIVLSDWQQSQLKELKIGLKISCGNTGEEFTVYMDDNSPTKLIKLAKDYINIQKTLIINKLIGENKPISEYYTQLRGLTFSHRCDAEIASYMMKDKARGKLSLQVPVGVHMQFTITSADMVESSIKRGNIKVKFALFRHYIDGGKLAARYSQKGTIGVIKKRNEMPYVCEGDDEGMYPEILISPAAFPSRQTLSLIIELLSSTAAVVNGKISNGTPFRYKNIQPGNPGYDKYLNEQIMYIMETIGDNGVIKKMRFPNGTISNVFMAPMAWCMLKHHAEDKFKVLDANPFRKNTGISRQPTSGRHGGLVFGVQEIAAAMSADATGIRSERTSGQSDFVKILLCKDCGLRADKVNVSGATIVCPSCGGQLVRIHSGYALEAFKQIIGVVGMDLRVFPEVVN